MLDQEFIKLLNQTLQNQGRSNLQMSLDQTLINLNETLTKIGGLLEVIQVAILIIAIALSILLVGITATCYYAKYKKYNQVSTREPTGSYSRGNYHPTEI